MPKRPAKSTRQLNLELPAELLDRLDSHLAPHKAAGATTKGFITEMIDQGIRAGHVPAPTPKAGRPKKTKPEGELSETT